MAAITENLILMKTKSENLAAVKNLNLWGTELKDISLIEKCPNLEVLALSVNRVSSLESVSKCKLMRELYLRKNEVSSFDEVIKLSKLPKLTTLWLSDNPIAKQPNYRNIVIKYCPFLKQLDTVEVTESEREWANRMDIPLPVTSQPTEQPALPPPRPGPTSPTANAIGGRGNGGDRAQRAMLKSIVALLGELSTPSLQMLKQEIEGRLSERTDKRL
eukprot:Tbor_TRINITY_DN2765_c0_g1::TRINITY_DN2765_c0_g1_i1::g.15157::m.15157